MREMFSYCTSLKNLDLSSFNTSSVDASESMFSSVPAQCFVYMPTGVINNIKNQRSKNLVLKDGSTWTCANCVLADGETLTLPYGFKALDGVTYERSIAANNGNGYTVFLPYDCPIPEGVTAYTLRTDEQSLLGEDKIVFAPIEGDVLKAYNPYLLVNSGEDLTNLNTTVDTQVLPTTTATAEKTFGDMRFTGTMRTISNEEAAGMGAYIMQTGCRWKKVMTSSPTAYIPAYRAYLISPSGEAQTRATLFDGTTVGIDPVAASGKLPAGDDNIYDLQGRCVATKGQWSVANGQLSIATGKLPKGVYITNGHRYVVK
jgi:surface protein